MGHFLGGANVTGAIVASGGAIVGGANVGGATVGGATVGGAFDVGANVAEQMSRSNCRVLRSKCRRSNRRRSMCRVTTREDINYVWGHLYASALNSVQEMN